jgi:tetratricopeptide (TPR) repeat protein
MTLRRAAAVLACCLIGTVPCAASGQTYDEIILSYRRGDVDRAVGDMVAFLRTTESKRERDAWLRDAVRQKRGVDVAAALLLHTEVTFDRLAQAGFPSRGYMLVHVAIVEPMHDALRKFPERRAFLRLWYLLWESLRQANPIALDHGIADYLREGLEVFPGDGELLLAMGARYELNWWYAQENSHHGVNGRGSGDGLLRTARDYLRKSVSNTPTPSEAVMRLCRVLTQLGELDAAESEIQKFKTVGEGPAFRYLGLLFEGDLQERRGNLTAAARAYDQAIGLVGVPQSALLARAHVAYALGERREAAARVATAMALTPKQSDPWWWYIRGMSWRVNFYLATTRKMVQQ